MRSGIRTYNAAQGITDFPTSGYHETMTHACLHLVHITLCQFGPAESVDACKTVNTNTMMEFLVKMRASAEGADSRLVIILDDARYQHCRAVKELAADLNIELVFLPGYSPHFNLIERVWKFFRKEAFKSRYFDNSVYKGFVFYLLITQVEVNFAAWKIPAAEFAFLTTPLFSDYTTALAISDNPAIATKSAINATAAKRPVLTKALQPIVVKWIYGNPNMTNADRINCGCPPYKGTHAPKHGRPNGTPHCAIATKPSGHAMLIPFLNEDTVSGRPSRAKPAGVTHCIVRFNLILLC